MVLLVVVEIVDLAVKIWKAFVQQLETGLSTPAPDQDSAPRRRAL